MRRLGIILGLLTSLAAGQACAATITVFLTDLQAQIADFGGGTVLYDARGGVLAQVNDPGPLGGLIISGNTAAPFGQTILDAFNGAVTETGAIVLDFANLSFQGPQLLVPAAFFPGAPNPPTDAALIALSLPTTMNFFFNFVDAQQIDLGAGVAVLSTFSLASIDVVRPVPEPATAALLCGGLALLAAGSLRRNRARQA